MCLWRSPRRWCLGAANHATDRLEILRVSSLEIEKERHLCEDAIAGHEPCSTYPNCTLSNLQLHDGSRCIFYTKDALAFAFQYSEDGTIHVDKTQRAFFNSITEWKHDTAEIAMCAYRMAVALKNLCASHRSDHAALGAGAPYIPPTDAEMLIWRSGRAAAAGVAAVLPDEVLDEA